jgi:hypothetical protein
MVATVPFNGRHGDDGRGGKGNGGANTGGSAGKTGGWKTVPHPMQKVEASLLSVPQLSQDLILADRIAERF